MIMDAVWSVMEFVRPRPWRVHSGIVSRVRITERYRLGRPCHENRFLLDGLPVRHVGKALFFCEGDHATVVGWPDDDGFEACFVVSPGWNEVFRPYSTARCVFLVLVLALAAIIAGAASLLLPGLALALLAASSASYALDWARGERIARRHMLACRQPA